MEELVRKVLSQYTSYQAEAEMCQHWLAARENEELRQDLTLLEMKISVIKSWFILLNADERFVVEKHLVEELEWPRVAFAFSEKWKSEFSRTERSLVKYQAGALKKIVEFSKIHQDIVVPLFSDLLEIAPE